MYRTVALGDATVHLGSGISRPFYDKPVGRPVLRSTNIKNGVIVCDEIKYWHNADPRGADLSLASPRLGDILVNFVNGSAKELGKAAVYRGQPENCIVTTNFFIVRFDERVVASEFAQYIFQSDLYKKWLYQSAGFSGQGSFNKKEFSLLRIPAPSLSVQNRATEILRAWDEALEKLNALRATKKSRLGALQASVLFGNIRLSGHRYNWETKRLGAVLYELNTRNLALELGRDIVMGVTKTEGLVPMREQTIAGDISRYKRLPPRAFAYNPMRINVGSIAMNKRDREVLVSPDYVVFACNPDGLNPDYLEHLRETSWWTHYINSGGSSSVRQRTYYDDLAALRLPLPELDEQKAIVAVLDTARDDLLATEREIEARIRQKRGLMQKLLTGEWQVPLHPTDASPATQEMADAE